MSCQATASPAPAENVARRILGEVFSQIESTTKRLKPMVGRVLSGNGSNHEGQGRLTKEMNR